MSRQFHSIPTSPLLAHPQQVPTMPTRSPETVPMTTHTAATEDTTTTKPTTSPYLALYKNHGFHTPRSRLYALDRASTNHDRRRPHHKRGRHMTNTTTIRDRLERHEQREHAVSGPWDLGTPRPRSPPTQSRSPSAA
ncbi:hypothetical protein B0H15DRAFT_945976 [Mycena belliarum]|uniref:Uncharacterized protein n=1 Tax=Mycena belliarum TaxID=1033014 RepID=A0AAD6UBS4_9AGAR|nr:hypothetical protein B0H15DRAFT_945976 [Mycena belliae]